jgi:hypothetical protein
MLCRTPFGKPPLVATISAGLPIDKNLQDISNLIPAK